MLLLLVYPVPSGIAEFFWYFLISGSLLQCTAVLSPLFETELTQLFLRCNWKWPFNRFLPISPNQVQCFPQGKYKKRMYVFVLFRFVFYNNFLNKGRVPKFSQICVWSVWSVEHRSQCFRCLLPPAELHPHTCQQWATVRFTVHTVCTTVYCTYSCFQTSESCYSVNYCFSKTDTDNHYNRVTVAYRAVLVLPPRGWILSSSPFLLTLTQKWSRNELLCFSARYADQGQMWDDQKAGEGVERKRRPFDQRCWTKPEKVRRAPFWIHQSFKFKLRVWLLMASVCLIFKVWFSLMGLFFSFVG